MKTFIQALTEGKNDEKFSIVPDPDHHDALTKLGYQHYSSEGVHLENLREKGDVPYDLDRATHDWTIPSGVEQAKREEMRRAAVEHFEGQGYKKSLNFEIIPWMEKLPMSTAHLTSHGVSVYHSTKSYRYR